ncbi:hypothetical protein RRG08_039089 [Elysia crispata]|uniref:Uncharacterized protein n=1 Tax=Elysia crispata TaxID=231223 RepID=A0AAE0YI01_9GAST|nr:hypothetical protein RRG08_039089 [Elysia crispata]
MANELKPKKLYSATLPHTWPKPVFPFKGSPGYLPVEAQPYVFVSRKTKHGGQWRHKVVPNMVFPIQPNRQPVPTHEVLEDDYRAFHNVLVNQLALARLFPQHDGLSLLNTKTCVPVNSALRLDRIEEVRDQLPELMAYNPGCQPPPGYMYKSYRSARHRSNNGKAARGVTLRCPPLVIIKDPFQNMVKLCTPNYCDNIKEFDSAVIGRTQLSEIRIYNEPDAISTLVANADFQLPISERAVKRVCIKHDHNMPDESNKQGKEKTGPPCR